RKISGVPSTVWPPVRSGTVISRISVSSTPEPLPSTDTRSCIFPGATSKLTRAGPFGDALWAAAVPPFVPGVEAAEAPSTFPRPHLQPRPLQPHLDLVELAVGRRLRRVVADQVIRARIARDLLHAGGDIVAVHDGAAVGLLGQRAQRVLRRREIFAVRAES